MRTILIDSDHDVLVMVTPITRDPDVNESRKIMAMTLSNLYSLEVNKSDRGFIL